MIVCIMLSKRSRMVKDIFLQKKKFFGRLWNSKKKQGSTNHNYDVLILVRYTQLQNGFHFVIISYNISNPWSILWKCDFFRCKDCNDLKLHIWLNLTYFTKLHHESSFYFGKKKIYSIFYVSNFFGQIIVPCLGLDRCTILEKFIIFHRVSFYQSCQVPIQWSRSGNNNFSSTISEKMLVFVEHSLCWQLYLPCFVFGINETRVFIVVIFTYLRWNKLISLLRCFIWYQLYLIVRAIFCCVRLRLREFVVGRVYGQDIFFKETAYWFECIVLFYFMNTK